MYHYLTIIEIAVFLFVRNNSSHVVCIASNLGGGRALSSHFFLLDIVFLKNVPTLLNTITLQPDKISNETDSFIVIIPISFKDLCK